VEAESLIRNSRVDLASLITHELPLERIEEGFAAIERQEAVKVVLRP
jgi:threonine dehydrogenase-like Zn-dependent dehydrogenase